MKENRYSCAKLSIYIILPLFIAFSCLKHDNEKNTMYLIIYVFWILKKMFICSCFSNKIKNYNILFETNRYFSGLSGRLGKTFQKGPRCCDWFEIWHLHSLLHVPLSLSFSSLLYCEMAPQMAALPHLFMCFRTVVVSFPPTCIKHRGITNSHWQSQHLGTYCHAVKQALSERS